MDRRARPSISRRLPFGNRYRVFSCGSDFNHAYDVSFMLDEIAKGTCFIGTYRQPRPATLRALAPVAPKLRHETLEMAGS
jgi:hypothetical protein